MSVPLVRVVVLKTVTTLLAAFHVAVIMDMNYLLITRVAMVSWCNDFLLELNESFVLLHRY